MQRPAIMTLAGFAAYSFALFVAAAIPGPGVTALIARALGTGFAATLPWALGLIVGDLVFLTAVLLGLAVLAQTFGTAFLIIKLAGAAYLGWLALRIWRSGIQVDPITAHRSRKGALAAFVAGLLVTLGNPKTMLFYVAITPTIIDLASVTLTDYLILVSLTAVVLLIVLVPYLALAAKARSLLARPRLMKLVNRTAALFLGGAALAIALRR